MLSPSRRLVGGLVVALLLAVLANCRESERTTSIKPLADCTNVGKLPEKQFKQCACQEIDGFLDEVKTIHLASSRSARTTRREEMEEFTALARKFEASQVFLRLPGNLKDYILSHNELWEGCRSNDEMEKCSQATGIRSTIKAMCNQWRKE